MYMGKGEYSLSPELLVQLGVFKAAAGARHNGPVGSLSTAILGTRIRWTDYVLNTIGL